MDCIAAADWCRVWDVRGVQRVPWRVALELCFTTVVLSSSYLLQINYELPLCGASGLEVL